ncbi:unnamed protein product [Mycena citricolor]|uniref:HMG domain-containing protein n=1 Tax=Mycena citricolor TaxID=2018698 RepID=A0AAD2JXI5_9AGAR|nr:unnamed protein product [Mycena citricolor]
MANSNSDDELILLQTPPPSPPALIVLGGTPSYPNVSQALDSRTPTRKRRRVEEQPRNAWSKRTKLEDSEPANESEHEISWDEAADALLLGGKPDGDPPPMRCAEQTGDTGAITPGYAAFCDLIVEDGGAFYQITEDLFVSSGWDPERKSLKASWHHLQRSIIGDSQVVVCQCPLARNSDSGVCVHTRFLDEEGQEHFPAEQDHFDSASDATLFSRQETGEDTWLNVFSCCLQNARSLNGRVIIEHLGTNNGAGKWTCSKDSGTLHCLHIHKCRNLLQKLLRVDPSARHRAGENEFEAAGSVETANPIPTFEARGTRFQQAISHLPVLAPTWASLTSDPVLYQRSAPAAPPEIIKLTETSSCLCTKPRYRFQLAAPTLSQSCIVYGLSSSSRVTIELQRCQNPRCSHRFIGPDCRELGIFNYNNQRLFTHELLDEYTSAYTSSETPFSAWVSVVSRRYALHNSTHTFPSPDIFRSAWFMYVSLQYLDNSMICPRCGPNPDTTIWDGVTLAFNKKHLLSSLEPPTVSQLHSFERKSTRYLPGQQLISASKLRRMMRSVLVGPPLTKTELDKLMQATPVAESEDEEDDEDHDEETETAPVLNPRGKKALEKARKTFLERLEMLPMVVEGLKVVDEGVSRLFDKCFGPLSVLNTRPTADVYHRFFLQLAAEESVLQFAPPGVFSTLQAFLDNPNRLTGSALSEVPALHEVLAHERAQLNGNISEEIIHTSRWLLARGRAVFNALVREPAQLPGITQVYEKSWKEASELLHIAYFLTQL